jgi:hypothetical protein
MDKNTIFFTILITFIAAVIVTNVGWAGICYPGLPCNIYFVSIFAVLFYGFYRIFNAIPVAVKHIRTPKPKNLRLYHSKLQNNEIQLVIRNNERRTPNMIISKMGIGHKDGISENQEPDRWSRVSKIGVQIKKGDSRTARFIKEDKKQSGFSIVEYIDDQEALDVPIYKFGIHKFIVRIVYGFRENEGLIKWFDVDVHYKAAGKFDIKIKHYDKKNV